MSKLSVCAVIPARYGSTRFPGKSLALIAGNPMIQHVYERTVLSKLVQAVYVATDDQRIYDAVIGFGGNVVMTSPDHASGTDRIAEAVQNIQCEWVVNVQGDEPLIDPSVIDAVVSCMKADRTVTMATPIASITDIKEFANPNVVKVVCDKNGYALYFSRAGIPYKRDTADSIQKMYKHIGLYGYRKDFLLKLVALPQSELETTEKLEQLRVLENGYKIKTVHIDYRGIGVDTPEDLEEIQKYL